MKKNILFFRENSSVFLDKFFINIVPLIIDNANIYLYTHQHLDGLDKRIIQIIQPNLNYLSKSRSYLIYQDLLNFCQNNQMDKLYFLRLEHPEFLLFELKTRAEFFTKIFPTIFGLQDVNSSLARKSVYEELIQTNVIDKFIIFSIIGKRLDLSLFSKQFISSVEKLYDPIYEKRTQYSISSKTAKDIFNLDKNKFYILFFGSMFYGKGIDIFYNAIKLIQDSSIRFIIASNPDTINFEFSPQIFKNHANITYLDKFIKENMVGSLFRSADAVVLPYRQTYEWGTSGVLVQAALAKKPIICPDIYPFSTVCANYNLGKLFSCENSESLADSIMWVKNNTKTFQTADFNKYLNLINSTQQVADLLQK